MNGFSGLSQEVRHMLHRPLMRSTAYEGMPPMRRDLAASLFNMMDDFKRPPISWLQLKLAELS